MTASPLRSERAAVLIIALLLAAVVAISLTSYLQLSTGALNLANRTFHSTSGVNLAETGLEQAIWSFNRFTGGDTAVLDAWDRSGNNATRKWTGFTYQQGTTGEVRIYVQDYNATAYTRPTVVAESIITPHGSPAITTFVEIVLKRRTLFAMGLVAQNGIQFSGNNATVDSWNSDPDNDPATPAIPYDSSVDHDLGSIGSIAVDSTINVMNADIWGFASVGSSSSDAIRVGPNGRIGPYGTAAGAMDPSRIATDFTADLEIPTAPTATPIVVGAVSATTTFPRGGDTPAADGKYYYQISGIGLHNGTLDINGGDVVIITPTGYGIDIGGGSGGLNITTGSSLAIYAGGDINVGGNGVMNGGTTSATAQQAEKLQIWGTGAPGQSIKLAGNGVLSGVVYAPNAAVSINGNGDVLGSVVAGTINVTGNANFHYDEALANFGSDRPFGIVRWRELITQSDRSAYAAALDF